MRKSGLGIDDALYDYVLDVSLREADVLRRLREETTRMPGAVMQVAPDQGQFMALEDKNVQAFEELHRLIKAYQPQEATGDRTGYLVVPADMTPEEWIAEAERKNELMDRYGVRNLAALAEIERREKCKKKLE